jgi:hypothetical protein
MFLWKTELSCAYDDNIGPTTDVHQIGELAGVGGWRKILLGGVSRVLSGVKGGFRHSGGGFVLLSQGCFTVPTFCGD